MLLSAYILLFVLLHNNQAFNGKWPNLYEAINECRLTSVLSLSDETQVHVIRWFYCKLYRYAFLSLLFWHLFKFLILLGLSLYEHTTDRNIVLNSTYRLMNQPLVSKNLQNVVTEFHFMFEKYFCFCWFCQCLFFSWRMIRAKY